MSDKLVLVRTEDKVCTVVLNRPDLMNALDLDLVGEFREAVDRIAADESVRVVVLEGAGGNFCAGSAMNIFAEGLDAPFWQQGMRKLHNVIHAMRQMPQPLVAKVRGVAVGGGINIALACDFVVAAHTARFREVFVNHNLIIDCGGTYFLPRLVGLAKARELALLGGVFDGKTAAEKGLIYKSVPEEELDGEVKGLAANLAKKPLMAMSLIKKSLDASFEMSLPQVLEWEAAQQAIMAQTEELKEAGRRFLEKHGKAK